jgi:hypothetical protein
MELKEELKIENPLTTKLTWQKLEGTYCDIKLK